MLAVREQFFAGEKLALRCRGRRLVVKALSDYFFQVEDPRNGSLVDVHGTRFKFFRDFGLGTSAILPHVLSSETSMLVARLMKLMEDAEELKALTCWKGLSNSDETGTH